MNDKYIFIDRDGVINYDGENITEHWYIARWEDFSFIPGVLEAFKLAKEKGYKCVIISNQQCVGKEIISLEELDDLTSKMTDKIREFGGDVAAAFFCPHKKAENCKCRKPKPGLFEMAQKKLGIPGLSKNMYFVGDSETDIIAAHNAGVSSIIVLTGKNKREQVEVMANKPDHVSEDLLEAVKFIVG